MADPKPSSPKPADAKPPKKKLSAAMAMIRVERMMEELDADGRMRLAAFVRQAYEEKQNVLTPTPSLTSNVMHPQQPGV